MNNASERQLHGLSTLVNLERSARNAETHQELGFVIANETHNLVPYRNAVLWIAPDGRGRVQTISGVAHIENDAPFVNWITGAFKRLDKRCRDNEPHIMGAEDITEAGTFDWNEWFPEHGLMVPLVHPTGRRVGALLLTRETPWLEHETRLLVRLAEDYAHCWEALGSRRGFSIWLGAFRKKWLAPTLISAFIAASFYIPVQFSVLAPGKVGARDPWVVRAPVDGVVLNMKVQPNEQVEAGRVLFNLDSRAIENQLSIARRKLAVAEAEFRQLGQKAMFDPDSKARLFVAEGKRDLQTGEVTYLEELLGRVEVKARRGGIAIYSDPSDWEGRPVQTGEGILTIADTSKVELVVYVSVDDAIILKPGSDVRFFLTIAPETPLKAVIMRAAYEDQMTASGTMAYRVIAQFDKNIEPPRIGLSGTAKVYGKQVSLFYYLLRRPISFMRRWLGI